MSIASKLEYLDGTKDYIRQCIQQKGVVVDSSTTFRQYGDKILQIETEQHPPDWGGEGGEDGEIKLTTGIATATGQDFVLSPPEGYNGFSSVNVTGDYNLKPENIAEGITIYGVTGTMPVSRNTNTIPSAYETLFEQARQQYSGEYKNLMILESNDTVAFGFMLDNFKVDNYDKDNTEFYASGWVYVAYNKSTRTWKVEPWQNTTSNGNSYIKNIRYCDTYIYWGGILIYPMGSVFPGLPQDKFVFAIRPYVDGSRCIFSANFSGFATIEWGDGYTNKEVSGPTCSHIYEDNNEYIVTITGAVYHMWYISSDSFRLLSSLPTTLLDASSMFSTNGLHNPNLDSIPTYLLANRNPDYTLSNIDGMFYKQKYIPGIPDGLFDEVSSILTTNNAFDGATNLTYIPSTLFHNQHDLNSATSIFKGTGIISVPEGLFSECNKLQNLNYAFSDCKALHSIPSKMFPENPEVDISLAYIFENCDGITSIPDAFFKNLKRPSNINGMFYNCNNLTYIPPLWDESIYGTKYTSIQHNSCFYGCNNAVNYKDLPSGWR